MITFFERHLSNFIQIGLISHAYGSHSMNVKESLKVAFPFEMIIKGKN